MKGFWAACLAAGCLITAGCAQVSVPDARTVDVPTPKAADSRKKAANERPDSVMYLPLGEDVLVPETASSLGLPYEEVGPFELRSETLAGALQLILADYDVSLAFETDEGLNRRVTVANLRGPLKVVVEKVCSLADLYCSYEDNILVVKDTETFTVTLPPIGGGGGDGGDGGTESTEFLDDVAEGLGAILGEEAEEPIVDPTTRTIVYTATQRTAEKAARYFQRLRANTALIVFETYIWEVQLNSGNSTGIDWDQIDTFGKFNASFAIDGSVASDFTNPVSIGLPTTQNVGATPTDLVQFLSQFGAVKSISQPQITVLSGSSANLRVADTDNYVSEITTTLDEGQSTTAVSTDTVDSGFELGIASSWDKATVYANIDLQITSVIDIVEFPFTSGGEGDDAVSTSVQLPQTTERELTTNIRMRPGDSVLIAGLVREDDRFNTRGPGIAKPILPDSRTAETENLELVILMRPRVVVYTDNDDFRYLDYVDGKKKSAAQAFVASPEPAYAPTLTPPAAPLSVPAPAQPEYSNIIPEPVSAVAPAPVVAEPVAPAPALAISPQNVPVYQEPVPVDPPYIPAEPQAVQSPVLSGGRLGGGLVSRSSDLPAPASAVQPLAVQEEEGALDLPSVETFPIDTDAAEPIDLYPSQAEVAPTVPAIPATLEAPKTPVRELSPYETYEYVLPTY